PAPTSSTGIPSCGGSQQSVRTDLHWLLVTSLLRSLPVTNKMDAQMDIFHHSDQDSLKASGAERQAMYKERMRKAGYVQRTNWFHKPSEDIGFQQGAAGILNPLPHPDGVLDELSYLAGWSRGLDAFAII